MVCLNCLVVMLAMLSLLFLLENWLMMLTMVGLLPNISSLESSILNDTLEDLLTSTGSCKRFEEVSMTADKAFVSDNVFCPTGNHSIYSNDIARQLLESNSPSLFL